MVGNGPSPKRRRTDNGPVSAEAIAQSNATVNHFTGQGSRQNRWMQGLTSEANGEGGVSGRGGAVQTRISSGINTGLTRNTPSTAQPQQQESPTGIPSLAGLEGVEGAALIESLVGGHGDPTGTSSYNFRSMEDIFTAAGTNGTTSEDAILVDYESPNVSTYPRTTGIPHNSRKSLEAQARTATRQGLPSPAPSDENSNSLAVAEAAGAPRRPGRPSASDITGFANASSTASPTTIYRMQDGSLQQVPLSQLPHPVQRTLPSNAPAAHGSPRLLQNVHTHAPSPLQRHQPSPVTAGPSPNMVSSSLQTQNPAGFGAQWPQSPQAASPTWLAAHEQRLRQIQQRQQAQQRQQPAPPLPLGAFFDSQALLLGISGQLQVFERRDPSGRSVRGETGRLCLLRDAVQKGDYFYIVLSQLLCLRSISPTSLPASMGRIKSDSYDYLDALLCANSTLHNPLVQWFADFPRPIMQIYSAPHGEGQAYEAQVRSVVQFVEYLPLHWGTMVMESRRREAPPLVQDMSEKLWLFSPVLQTTAFRAIARTFWGNTPDVEAGIEALVEVHHVDQRTFHPLSKRSPADLQRAYAGYKFVFDAWQMHDQATKQAMAEQIHQRSSSSNGYHPPPFRVPTEAWAAFGINVQQHQQQQQQQPNPALLHQQQQRAQNTRLASQQPRQTQTPTQNIQAGPQRPQPQRTPSQSNTAAPAMPSASPVQQLQQQLHQQQSAFSTYQPVPAIRSGPPLPRGKRPLFPAEKDCPRPQPTHPDTTRAALHQAHLRSPIAGWADVQPGAPKLYRHVKACSLSPTRIDKDKPVQTLVFEIGAEMLRLAKTKVHPDYVGQSIRLLQDGSVTFRLRCCREDRRTGFPTESSWVTSDCYWPETAYFDINGEPLEPRRKLQHGRYQAMDLTPYIRAGENELKVTINRSSTDTSPFDFAVGVEMVETMSEERVVGGIETIGVEESVTAIKDLLSGGGKELDDDDVVMTSSAMNISLFDPFSGSKIFDTPVRGRDCKHRDPFDLDTFLATRKREKAGYPTVVDGWLCPHCRGDVRPELLRKDAFLMRVREDLELLGQLDTRAIVVNADGSWSVKEEERTGVRSSSLEREEAQVVAKTTTGTKTAARKPAPVVIELD
ncbi:hypothetical protein LTR36_007245 [Oleoguttula mirabilis]|uniref:SP-RING-type domain-containing protein n=1 Tax=Oleoguttula mirabilis TaxID=1507867 RepID=A0AAV9JA99_9PEZI|nr:hypothetical protein LTR36_007245 [Oleoguttula mirabilis]